MRKKGFTIVELLVATGIFAVITTLAIGAFVSINRFRDLGANMAESQQKVKIAVELISRLTRQAEDVVVSADGKTIDLGFNMDGTNPSDSKTHSKDFNTYARFKIDGENLYYYTEQPCVTMVNAVCTARPNFDDVNANPPVNLLEGANGTKFSLQPDSSFSLPASNTLPLRLYLYLNGNIGSGSSSDQFKIDTSVILENVGV